MRARGLRIAILDADFNGPSQARMAGVQGAVFVPPPPPAGSGMPGAGGKMPLPRTSNGIAVFSMGSLIPESAALEFASTARGESHTWRATREFALLGEILASVEWGPLDLLMFDLPPGAERTVQYADYLGAFDGAQGRAQTSFVLVTIPSEVSRGVVARSIAALSNAGADGAQSRHRIVGYIENMSGYYCRDCDAIKPLFPSTPPDGLARGGPGLDVPCLGTVPFDPELARHCDGGTVFADLAATPAGRALDRVAQQLLDSLESNPERPR
jgi:ATP-binding protein involved in chromosome partitioning